MTESTIDPGDTPRVVALSADLIDRSKISAAFPDAIIVRSVVKLSDAVTTNAVTTNAVTTSVGTARLLVFVDLGRVEDVTVLQELGGHIIGFGSHVNEEQLAAARAVGIEALPRSVFFRRLENGDF
ncbi:hypothetical protein N9V91_04755 [Acidimicrobiaceae bacterium]|nr:hypothetical protein [Acidimicrobiaceae bacterium]